MNGVRGIRPIVNSELNEAIDSYEDDVSNVSILSMRVMVSFSLIKSKSITPTEVFIKEMQM